ncbi:DNA polymerase III subunit gamma and tau [Streptomyces albidoflavus]|uniref:DNA polymerase III subunit gamma/tau n=2 Tax=Streptomyces TaxID=1883 RepID=A0A8F6I7K6_9ACTN|nr:MULTISPECIES: DNA polymerase III subunit gamma and tau [Streptomyces]KDR61421.1 DNA polymerase III subunit gamma/tau [Streptomyces wadayamensis]MCX4441505.1 DNA polymerase III subunit gamma and tau [Streptomyces albidoflavus]QXQ26022.1 DNA polymerase III subunit gamma and tau [Streptomyces albidoflavus]QXQ31951.1 DNA polymerase III subunit gamma and tau [Streptomyces albidoflavus]RZE22473.1 DNA polymerase III subunit gamma and tau [Streptomyces albidoflavus]
MSSLALYRRYRPESFAEVIGQEHVTDPLQQALRNNRVNHAYLFSGPRGCGKTTSARILARCLNCEQGPTPDPCGTCQSCQDLARNGPGSIDVIEIDAASHGGVDDARDLREKAFFGPASSRYKIYIIDEAHMVTSAGFNALLKVVEEPPEHLKFIFATTEPEKVIGTIRSRTHHYPFRLVPPGTLREYLAEVCGKEGSRVEDGVLPLVVRAGAGSVRDSMSVMDQLLAGAGEDGVTYAMATALLGYTDGSLLDSVVDAFAAGDGAAAFEVVDRVVEGGNDPRRFVADLLERLRDLVILAAVPDAAEKGLIDAPADLVERMQAQASVFGAAELSRAADLVNEGLTEMRGATSPRLQLELICARVLLPAAYDDERSTLARLERLERSGPPAQAAAPLAPQAYAPAQPQVPQAPPAPAPTPAPQQSAPPAAAPDAPPADAAPARPGAWPGSAPPGSGAPAPAARRPGGWPTAGAGGGPAPQQAEPQGPGRPQGQPQPQAAPATPPPGAVDARALWPNVLEAVKNRRRFTWILLSQNAHVAGFDGTTLQLGFLNAGARDNFASSGSEDVLKQALGEEFQVNWKIETVIDASGGQGPATPPGGGGGGGWGQAPAQPRPAAPAPAPAPAPPQPGPAAPPAPAPAPQGPPAPQREQRPPAPEPPRRTTSIEDDIPEEDDPDLDESALSGHDLIMRELGATVVEEYTNE